MKVKTKENLKKFTYGHQFEPEKASLIGYLQLCEDNIPSRDKLEKEILNKFFTNHSNNTNTEIKDDNQKKLAMNCFLSLRSYGLVSDTGEREYELTELSKRILSLKDDESKMYREFVKHILLNLSGTDLLKAIEAIVTRGEEPTLQNIIDELNEMGYLLSKNVVYVSTMRQWLSKAGLFQSKGIIAWDVYNDITGISFELLQEAYNLTPEQKYFLLSMLDLGITEFTEWSKILEHTVSIRKFNYDMKMFPKSVLEPLIKLGLIEMEKATEGRGAKPNRIKLTEKAQREILTPFIKNIANLTKVGDIELSKSLENVIVEISSPEIHIKGKALELLAIWMVRLCSLRFTAWRKRDVETGKGEVDVMAASDNFVYSKWQVQCKNTSRVDVDVVAKELGMTFVTNADVVLIVTTGEFTNDARIYADRVSTISRYYVILLDKNDIASLISDKTSIVPILNAIAKRTFARREYGLTNEEFDEISSEPS